MAAAAALKSFTSAVFFGRRPASQDQGQAQATGRPLFLAQQHHHIPWLLALYDALNDDDDEVRELAASAAAPVLGGQQLAPMEAARRLLGFLASSSFASAAPFRAHAAGRMVGHVTAVSVRAAETKEEGEGEGGGGAEGPASWTPAETQLRAAMRFDDALFVVEEQNLFVDEVREARRWRDVLLSSAAAASPSPSSSSCSAREDEELRALAAWTLDGLRALTRLVRGGGGAGPGDVGSGEGGDGDGPLGWTSKPEVFAICARILISAAALSKSSSSSASSTTTTIPSSQIADALREFRDATAAAARMGAGEFHGSLLRMCE